MAQGHIQYTVMMSVLHNHGTSREKQVIFLTVFTDRHSPVEKLSLISPFDLSTRFCVLYPMSTSY